MPVPETPGKMYWCLTYGTHGVRKYVGFDSLDRQAGWHAIIPRAQWLSMREGSLCRYGQQGPEEQENQSRSQAKYRGAEQRYVHSPRWPLQSILNDPKTVATVPVSRLPNRLSVAWASHPVNSRLPSSPKRRVARNKSSREASHGRQTCAPPDRCQAGFLHTPGRLYGG